MARSDETKRAGPVPTDATGGQLAAVFWSGNTPRIVRLPPGEPLVVGRSEPADLVIEDPTLSRRHLCLTALGDYVRVEDLGSKNGITVGGRRTQETDVLPGGQVVAGSVRLVITRVGQTLGRLERLTTFDQLCDQAEAELARARTYSRPLTLALVQVRGRESAVDSALELRARLRPFDVVAIYDPTRLCALLPELDESGAAQLLDGEVVALASFPRAGSTVPALLRAALDGDSAPENKDLSAAEGLIAGAGLAPALALARRFSPSDLPVTVLGETGSGKEMLARQIHAWSPRQEQPMVVVNCAALAASLLESTLFGHERGAFTGADRDKAGLFEQAAGGTLFLDEIGELSAAGQAALLRVLEDKAVVRVGGSASIAVDVRVLAATNRDLSARVESGSFRLDLWHRLNALVVELPPLRERPDDLPELAARFLQRTAERRGTTTPSLSGEALQLLLGYSWPGNVRELQNVLERAALLIDGDEVDPSVLPDRIRHVERIDSPGGAPDASLRERVSLYEEQLIREALERCRGNQAAAARELGLPRRTLVRKLADFGLRHRDRYSDEDGEPT